MASSLQYGHSKSLKLTITTVAPGVPKLGENSVFSLSRSALKGLLATSKTVPCRIFEPSLETRKLKSCDCVPARRVNLHVQEAGQRRGWLGVEDLHADMRIHHEQVADIGLQRGLIQRGFLGLCAGPASVRHNKAAAR